MREVKVCRRCGGQVAAAERFCGECGLDTLAALEKSPAEVQPPAAPYHSPLGQGAGNKRAVLVLIAVLAVVFMGGGGLWWWFSRSVDPAPTALASSAGEKAESAAAASPDAPVVKPPDLTLAATYLPEPGLKYTFFVNYPNGTAGIVERSSARVAPGRTVRVSEVETGVERGEAFGHVFHYIERSDGTYFVLDQNPEEVIPLLKNNLSVGKTWYYRNEFGAIIWTVLDMGVDLDVGFTTFKNCLVVQEDNQPADIQSITYYAPGRGNVLVRDLAGGVEYYKVTGLTRPGEARTRETVIKWAPNYQQM